MFNTSGMTNYIKLARLKPNPVPSIQVTPEPLATGRLLDIYAQTKSGLGVPWIGVVAMAFARFPAFYDALWSAIEPIALTQPFASACQELRTAAESEAENLRPVTLLPELMDQGYNDGDITEIRACLETFSAGNMPYLILATLARLLLESHTWKPSSAIGPAVQASPMMSRPVLMEPHHADETILAVYADIRQVLGLPFVNTDYRALARWPSYFSRAWKQLSSAIQSEAYLIAVNRVHNTAVRATLELPNPVALNSEGLILAANEDGALEEIVAVVQLFQWLLPGLVINVAWLRAQMADG